MKTFIIILQLIIIACLIYFITTGFFCSCSTVHCDSKTVDLKAHFA